MLVQPAHAQSLTMGPMLASNNLRPGWSATEPALTTLPPAAPAALFDGPCTTGNLGGIVWFDYNSDGIRQSGEISRVQGVIVKVYNTSGTVVGTSTSDANGNWSVTGVSAYPVRVEFGNVPSYANSTQIGTNSRTSVQIVSAASCTVDFGIQNAADFCQTNPPIVVTCFVNGGINTTAPNDVLVKFDYNSSQTPANEGFLAQKNEMGSIYGLAYDKKRRRVYNGAFVKRHAALIENPIGTPQPGAIYRVNIDGTSPVLLTTISNAGTIASNATRELAPSKLPTQPSHDTDAFGKVGKVGLGDVEISDDMNTLYTVNLNTKQLVIMPLDASGNVISQSTVDIPNPCGDTDNRPFALKFYRNKLYVGVTCTEQTNRNLANLQSTVYEFDVDNNTFNTTPILTTPLNYAKDPLYRSATNVFLSTLARWRPWSDVYSDGDPAAGSTGSIQGNPQPLLSDIEFDGNGNMLLSYMDRWGHQLGFNNYAPGTTSTTLVQDGITGGDIRRACLINGVYVNEGSTGCSQNISNPGGNPEFFNGDFYYNAKDAFTNFDFYHEEITIGSMAVLPGTNEVAITALDPVNEYYSGGILFLSTTTGAKSKTGIEVYTGGNAGANFGKANGLGDLELLCNQAPKQVGNYIWIDTDRDGVQDPNEAGLNGVSVRLYKLDGGVSTLVASTTTATVNGTPGFYSFTDASTTAFTILEDNKTYYVAIGINGSQFNTTSQVLTVGGVNYQLTTANTGAGDQPDANDSDGVIYTPTGAPFTNYPVTSVLVGEAGYVNHTLDFGLVVEQPASISVTSATVCYGTPASLTATGCTGTVSWNTGFSGNVLAISNPTQTTSYTATCTTSTGSTASAVGTITVFSQPVLNLQASANPVTAGTPVSLSATGCVGTVNWSTGVTGSTITVTPVNTTQTYSATCTTGPSCFTTASITISTAPPANIVVTSATVCYGSPANLTATGCTGTVSWNTGFAGDVLTTPALTTTTSYTATCTTSTGSTAFAVGTVTVLLQPVLSLQASSTLVTAGTPVSLSAIGCVGTVNWSTGVSGSTITVTPVNTTQTYSATCTTGPSCFTTASIVINTAPPANLVVTSATVCYGSPASLTATGCTGTVSWNTGFSGNVLTTPALTTTTSYTATCTTSTGSTTSVVGTVTVLPQPVLSLQASSTLVTAGTPVSLSAIGCVGTVNWSTGVTGSTITVTPVQTTQTYSATCTTGPSCFTTASIVINTTPPANIVVTSATVCYGSPASLTATGCTGTVSWNTGFTGNVLTTPALTQTTSYTATCTTSTGSTTSVVGTVTVLPQPVLSLQASANPVTIGTPISLSAIGCVGTVSWSTGETGSTINVTPINTTQTYFATCTTGPGCFTTTSITITTQPPASIVVTSATVCYGSPASLTATGCTGTVSWNTGFSGNVLTTPALTQTTSYTATCTTSTGSTNTAVGTVTVLPQPVLSVQSSSTLVTASTPVSLSAIGCVGTVNWSTGVTGSTITVTPMQTTQTYSATCTTGPSCFTTASIVINTAPPASIMVTSATVCYGSPASLTAIGCTGTVSWNTGFSGNVLTTPALTTTTSYTATCTTSTGSTTSVVGTVTVLPQPVLSLQASSTLVTASTPVSLSAIGCVGTVNWSTGVSGSTITVTPMQTTQTYSATCTTGPSCFTTASIVINTAPPASIMVTSATVCYGSPASLTAIGCTGTVSWNTGFSGNVLTTPALTTTTSYTATCTTSTGSTTSVVGTVTVLPQPVLSLQTSSTLVTASTPVSLSAIGCVGTVNWSTGVTGSTITVTPMQTTQTYSATCTTGPSCFTTASIVINTAPPASIMVTSATVCFGTPASLTAIGCTGTVSWNTGFSGNVLTTPALTTTTSYTATCTTSTGSTTSVVGTVTVLPQPVLSLQASSTLVTASTPVSLSAIGCVGTVNWSTGVTGSTITVTPMQTTQTYSATCTTGPSCFTTASIVINTAPPASIVVTSATVCYGTPASLTAIGCTGTVSWNTGFTGNVLTTPALTQTTSYTATCTTSTGSTTSVVGTVTVLPQPVLSLQASSTLVTASTPVSLSAIGCVGTVNWSTGVSGSTITVTPMQTTQTYSATCTTGPSCFTTASIVINTAPPASIVVTSATVCYGTPASLTATGCTGTISWSDGTTGAVLTTPALTATTSYTATCTTSTGSTSTAVGTVTVLPQPVLSLQASSTLVTASTPVSLSAIGCVGTVNWSTGVTGSTITVTPMQTTQTYSATCTTGPSCFTTASIVINTAPPASIVVTSATVCYGLPASLTAIGCTGTISWSDGTTGAVLNTPTLTTTTSYTATCTTSTGSTTSVVGTVTVLPQPVLSLQASSTLVTAGSPVSLSAVGCAGTVNWSTGDTGSTITVSPVQTTQTYSATCITGPSCFTTATIDLATVPPSSIVVTSATVCYGSVASLTAVGCTGTISWNDGTTGSVLTTTALTQNTSYTATCTTSTGSTTSAVGTVTVLPQPILSLQASTTLLSPGTPVSLSAIGCEGTVSWSTGDSGSVISVTLATATQTYSATCTTGPGCFTTASLSIGTLASLGDFVFVDTNKDGVQQADEPGIPNVTVELFINGVSSATTVTNASGLYSFTGLTPGSSLSYAVGFTTPTGYTATVANQGPDDAKDSDPINGLTQSVTLASGENNTTLDAGFLLLPASLGDFVFVDTNKDGVQQADEPGIPNVTVELFINGVSSATTVTNASGLYSFTGLTPGSSLSYAVGFTTPNGYTATIANQGADDAKDSDPINGLTQSVTLAPGENNTTLDAGFFLLTASLGDFVFEDKNANGQQDAGDTPIPGVTVTLLSSGTLVASTTTDASGLYSFTGLTPGVPYSVSFTTPANYTATIQNTGSDVTDSDGDPVTGLTGIYSLTANEKNLTVDMGYTKLLPNLKIDKVVDKARAQIGDVLTYTLVLTNTGPGLAQNVTVRDSLSAGSTYVANSATAPAGTTFTQGSPISLWNVSTLTAGQSLTLTFQTVANSSGILYNTASIPGDTAQVCTSIPVKVCPGDEYTYRISVPAGRTKYQWFRTFAGITTELTSFTTNILDVSTPGEYKLVVDNQVGECSQFSCCPFIVEEYEPVGTYNLAATTPTCTGTAVQSNGSITLTGLVSTTANALTYELVKGATFASGTPITAGRVSLPSNGLLTSTMTSGTYWVRVYNATGCYREMMVVILPANCECPADVCVPFVLKQTKRGPRIGER
jgi:hypothetical protein